MQISVHVQNENDFDEINHSLNAPLPIWEAIRSYTTYFDKKYLKYCKLLLLTILLNNYLYTFYSDNLHYEKFTDGSMKCIEDEIPFEVPEGWAWSRLGTISSAIQYGLSNSAEAQGSHKLLRITDIQDGTVNWDNVPFTTTTDPDTYLLKTGDIVFARTGATVGKSFLITETPFPAVYASYLIRIRLIGDLPSEYIYQFFNSACYWSQITDKSVGVGQPNCNGTSLKELFIPLPPLNEQVKIIPIVETLLDYVKRIGLERTELLSILSATKSKILDLAIRGQLVPQNPDDEPASVLLERIRAEKEELIKQGKIKRDKKESIIFKGEDNSYYLSTSNNKSYDADVPFDIPDSWCWARLKDVFIINPRNKLDDNLDISFIPMTLIADGYSGKHSAEVRQWKEVKTGFTHFSEGDVGVAKITPCFENRKSTVFMNLTNGYGAGTTELHILRPIGNNILSQYLLAYLKSDYFVDNGKQTFTGAVGQQRISKEYIENVHFPIPPKSEQERIVQIINNIFEYLNVILDSLS